MSKSLHNQGVMEQEHVQLVQDDTPPTEDDLMLELCDPAKTKGASTRSESVSSEVR